MKQPTRLQRRLWRRPGWLRIRLYRLIAFWEDKIAFQSRGEICEMWEELEDRWNFGLSALEAKTGRDGGDEKVLARARRERFELRHDDLIAAPEHHDSYEDWIAWGQLEGQLMAMRWAMGSKLELPEESWSDSDSRELVEGWRTRGVTPNGADGEKDWLEKWTEGPSEDEIRMGTIEIGGELVYFVHSHNQTDEVKTLVDHAEAGEWSSGTAQQGAVFIAQRADHEACGEILAELLSEPELTAEKWQAIEAQSEEQPLE